MLIMAKSVLALMIGFMISAGFGLWAVPFLRKMKIGQNVSEFVTDHAHKQGTPTMGGIIFIIPALLTTLVLYAFDKIHINSNVLIIILVFLGYALIGFIDDYKKIKGKTNDGLSIKGKLILQTILALLFYFIFTESGGEPLLWINTLGIKIDLGYFYIPFILVMLVGMTNAVNLTDGLDGLAGGLSFIAFLAMGIVSWGTTWLAGSEDIAVLCFILSGSLLGFLLYNTNPAKVFMGDTGSLAIGGALATVALLTRHEVTLLVVCIVFILDAASSVIQIIAIRKFNRKVFPFAPVHHSFQKMGWLETDIVKLFWTIGFLAAAAALVFSVWI